MINYSELAEQYIAAWNQRSMQARHDQLRRLVSTDIRYADPIAQVHGIDQLNATITAVQEQFADSTFLLSGEADGHHDQMRLTWTLGPEGADPTVIGFDVLTIDTQGHINCVLGFLDKVPGPVDHNG